MSAPVVRNDPADPIDRLLWVTGGEVLRVGYSPSGGELDSWSDGAVSRRTVRRLAGAGLVSRNGLEPDRLQHDAAQRSAEVARMNPDEFVAWYVREALAGLDFRAARASSVEFERPEDDGDGWGDVVAPAPTGDIPGWVDEWIGRTVHAPKADYLAALAVWWYMGGTGEPVAPAGSDGWSGKARARFVSRARRAERLEREEVAA